LAGKRLAVIIASTWSHLVAGKVAFECHVSDCFHVVQLLQSDATCHFTPWRRQRSMRLTSKRLFRAIVNEHSTKDIVLFKGCASRLLHESIWQWTSPRCNQHLHFLSWFDCRRFPLLQWLLFSKMTFFGLLYQTREFNQYPKNCARLHWFIGCSEQTAKIMSTEKITSCNGDYVG
jgi:hypothetical protein